jgi:hypothetical protein
MQYKRTQNGVVVKASLFFGFTLCVIVGVLLIRIVPLAAIGVGFGAGLMLLLFWFFGSLTVEVTDEELKHWFGPGFWKKSYLLVDIESATQVKNSWIFGWGIRLTPHGWLYNVSGLDAVQIELCSGRTFRIGTDEPTELLGSFPSNNNAALSNK